MRWPWTSRVEAAEQRAATAEASAIRAEERLESCMADANQRVADAQAERDEAQKERKILIDRILSMSGQDPIFHPVPVSATPAPVLVPAPSTGGIAAPETRVSFNDVHRKCRAAIASGDIGILSTQGVN